ncbi:hypothetical protein GCK72_009926 [Caenorhabditis remanei]|uniref:Uncharacterized protein n=1 Tax=Caenorhabditis remanei TaxID=31234 RepID=A0A6A5H1I8_CAERE|nr:hypothetical protein GCK72_009926 [Caenorhabditis remanei]KAF1761670.1 hypothetical protein GCK72_009926 [Caenorhabditis remanei]
MAVNQSTTVHSKDATTEEFIQKYMSLIIAACIGTIILGLLLASGFMYLTKKKGKKEDSNQSKQRSFNERSVTTPPKIPTDKPTKSATTTESSMSSVISSGPSETKIETAKK